MHVLGGLWCFALFYIVGLNPNCLSGFKAFVKNIQEYSFLVGNVNKTFSVVSRLSSNEQVQSEKQVLEGCVLYTLVIDHVRLFLKV